MYATWLARGNKGPHPSTPILVSFVGGNFRHRTSLSTPSWVVTGSSQWDVRRVSAVSAGPCVIVEICEGDALTEKADVVEAVAAVDTTVHDADKTKTEKKPETKEAEQKVEEEETEETDDEEDKSDTTHAWDCECGECPELSEDDNSVERDQFLSRAERREKEEKEDAEWFGSRNNANPGTAATANLTICTGPVYIGPEHTWHRCRGFETVERNGLGHVAVRNDKVTSPRGTNYLTVPKPNSLARSKSGGHTMVVMRDEPAHELPGYCAGFAAEAAIAQIVAHDVEDKNRMGRLEGKPMLVMMRGATYWTEGKRRGKKREGDIIVAYAMPGKFVETPHGKKQLYRVVQVIEVKNTRAEHTRAKGFEQLYWMKHSTSDKTKWMVDGDGVYFRFDDDTNFLFASVRGGEVASSVGHVLEWMRVTIAEQNCGVRRAAEAAAAAETAAAFRCRRPWSRSRSPSRLRNESSPLDNKNWRRQNTTTPTGSGSGAGRGSGRGGSSGGSSGGWTKVTKKKKRR